MNPASGSVPAGRRFDRYTWKTVPAAGQKKIGSRYLHWRWSPEGYAARLCFAVTITSRTLYLESMLGYGFVVPLCFGGWNVVIYDGHPEDPSRWTQLEAETKEEAESLLWSHLFATTALG